MNFSSVSAAGKNVPGVAARNLYRPMPSENSQRWNVPFPPYAMPYVRIRSAAIALANQDRSEFLAWTAFGQPALRFLPVKRVVPRFAEAAASHPLLLTWARLASAAGKTQALKFCATAVAVGLWTPFRPPAR
jgi:hypothetical protein